MDRYVALKMQDIQENSWNPNVMGNAEFQWLKRQLDKDNGNFKQPIIVRKAEWGKMEIIDGAHRYRAMKELDFDDIIAIEVTATDAEARVKTIQMNKLRGTVDSVKLAELVSELKSKYWVTDAEIQEELSMEQKEMESLWNLTDFDMSFFDTDIMDVQLPEETIMVQFDFNDEQVAEIDGMTILFATDVKTLILDAVRMANDFLKEGKSLETETIKEAPVQDFDIKDVNF